MDQTPGTKEKDILILLSIAFILLVIPITIFAILNARGQAGRATIESGSFVDDQLLVTFKPEVNGHGVEKKSERTKIIKKFGLKQKQSETGAALDIFEVNPDSLEAVFQELRKEKGVDKVEKMSIGAVKSFSLVPEVKAAGDCTIGPPDTDVDAVEQEFIQLINQYRNQNLLNSLAISPTLQKSATWKSKDMATNNYFSHTDSLGRSPFQLMADCGHGFNAWKGENIAAGYTSALSVFNAWKDSPGHNSNMLGENYTVQGISRYFQSGSTFGYYWTNQFSSHNDSNDTTKPSVVVTSPSNGSTVSGQTAVTVSATDNVSVTKVELYLNGTLHATDSVAPYEFLWDTTTFTSGSYTLQAKAFDAAGNSEVSQIITVNLDNQLQGDLDGDGKVNIIDASIMTANWETSDPISDLNNDGKVNIIDASILTSNWTG